MTPLQPVGLVRSPFVEKFGLPRQGNLQPIRAQIEIFPEYSAPEAFRGLEGYSHLWLISLFHLNGRQGWQPTVRPPRLGGNQRMGVWATRSPYRPNPIGLSVVRLLEITHDRQRCVLGIEGPDLVDRTPILDIKPYIPYADSVPDAQGGFASEAPSGTHQLQVSFSNTATLQARQLEANYPGLAALIGASLSGDPRPAYHQGDRLYYLSLWDLEVTWRVSEGLATVEAIQRKSRER